MIRGLRRFYIDSVLSAENSLLELSDRETFHLQQVLRLKPGDPCRIFDRSGREAEARVEAISGRKRAQVRVGKISLRPEKFFRLRVAQAVPQRGKMDDLVKKAEELGVAELWAVETERTMVRMRPEAGERARKRWERIVVEAAKQSGNPFLTQVAGPISFQRLLEEELKPSDRAYLFHPDPSGARFSKVVEEIASPSLFLFFGPEGGFTEKEVRLAESRGVRKVFLGVSTLRVETAFLGAVSALQFLGNS